MNQIKFILIALCLIFQLSLMSQYSYPETSIKSGIIFNQEKFNDDLKRNWFPNRKTDFEKGLVMFGDLGFSNELNHFGVNLNLAWQSNKGWELGLGFGGHNNTLDIPINNENELLVISSTPVYVQYKYFITHFFDNIIKPYVKLSMGYGFNTAPEEGINPGNGVLFENGIGIQAKINFNSFLYVECGQYNFRAKGSIDNPNDNINLQYKVWFNDIVFRVGYGRRIFQ